MTTITLVADQLREAIDAIDQDVEQALADRARLAAALAALEGDAPAVAPAPPAAPKQPKARKAPRQQATVDYQEVASWVNTARRNGTYTQAELAKAFGVPLTTSKNYVTKCRKLGLLDPIDAKAINEPITRMPVNEEAARAAAAAQYPDSDPRKTATGYQPPTLRPATPAATVQFSIDDARAALDAAS